MKKKVIAYYDEATKMLYDNHSGYLATIPDIGAFELVEDQKEESSDGDLILELAKQGFKSEEIINMKHAGLI